MVDHLIESRPLTFKLGATPPQNQLEAVWLRGMLALMLNYKYSLPGLTWRHYGPANSLQLTRHWYFMHLLLLTDNRFVLVAATDARVASTVS